MEFGLPAALIASGLASSHPFSPAHIPPLPKIQSLFLPLKEFKPLVLAVSVFLNLKSILVVGKLVLFCTCLWVYCLALQRLFRVAKGDKTGLSPLPPAQQRARLTAVGQAVLFALGGGTKTQRAAQSGTMSR